MARTTQTTGDASADEVVHDKLIDEAEAAELERPGRQLFDLRTIIGGLFLFYGAYLTIRGVLDSQAAIEQAAGVRINLWTGLSALAVGGAFVAWALLRPLTIEQLVEAQADSADSDEHEQLREQRERPQH